MCRLLGWVSDEPTTLADLIGETDLQAFAALSSDHKHGWGLAWTEGDEFDVRKSPERALGSETFNATMHSVSTDVAVAHLRWATSGLAVRADNNHPFSVGPTAFAHNGAFEAHNDLLDHVPGHLHARRTGATDSELYYLLVLGYASEAPLDVALVRAAEHIAERHQFSSLNAFLATPDTLYALCFFDPDEPSHRASMDYFDLVYRRDDHAVIAASTGWGNGWTTVPNRSLLTVQRDTLTAEVRTVAEVLATA
jgi:predicted glutamine amidotransferase